MNWLLLSNSLLVSGMTTVMAVIFGLVAALWVVGLPKGWRTPVMAVAILSFALPPFLVTNCWLDLLGNNGLWRGWLPLNVVSLGGTVWILSLLLWPITLFAVVAAWQRLESSQLESDLAVTDWKLFRALLWPLARTSIVQAAILTFVLALNNFAVPAILQVKVYPAEIWVRFNTTFDTLGALQLSWPLVLTPLFLLLWMARGDFAWPRLEGSVAPELLRRQLGRGFFWSCGAGAIVLSLLALVVPLLELISLKRTWTEMPQAVAAGQGALWNSFFYAAAAATLVMALALATQTAVGGARVATTRGWLKIGSRRTGNRRAAFSWATLLWLPLLVPGVLVGIVLIFLFNRPWLWVLYQSAGIVLLAFVIRYLALAWHTVAQAFCLVDRDLMDDARLNGARRWQVLRFVQWPQIAPQVGAAWYIVFLLCLWDVESMILVVPPGGETLALRIFNLLHYGHNAQVNALCLTLLGVAATPLLAWKVWSLGHTRLSRFTQCALRFMALAFSALLLPGCAPESHSHQTPLASRIFSHVEIIGHRGVGVGELNKPRSVAVDKQDSLYVADMTGRIQKFSANGVFTLSWQMPQTDLGKPKGMCHDREGNIIVIEPHYQRVNHFSEQGKLAAQWGEKGTNAGQFMLPRAVAVNVRGEFYVSEYGAMERVQRFSNLRKEETSVPNIHFLNSFGHPGTGPGEFNRPEGLCIDLHDRVYVADSCNHRIQVFSSDGKFIRAYGKAGTAKGELSYPYDICVDPSGRQYVCEFGNSRIQVFDANDQPIEIIGGPGSEPGRFSNPWGVALDSQGNLYVADSLNHRVQKLVRNQKLEARNLRSAIPSVSVQAPTTQNQTPEKHRNSSSKRLLGQADALWHFVFGISLERQT